MITTAQKKSIIIKCLSLSLLVHVCGLFYLYRNPLCLAPTFGMFPTKLSDTAETLARAEKELDAAEALEEAFTEIVVAPRSFPRVDDMHFAHKDATAPLPEQGELHLNELFTAGEEALNTDEPFNYDFSDETEWEFFPETEEATALQPPQIHSIEKALPASRLNTLELFSSAIKEENDESLSSPISLIEPQKMVDPQIEEQDILSSLEKSAPFLQQLDLSPPLASTPPLDGEPPAVFMTPQNTSLTHPDSWGQRKVAKNIQLRSVSSYALPQGDKMLSWQDDFDVEVSLMPQKENQGFVFSILLKPHPTLSVEPLKQNFYFFIDRSSSVEKHRYATFKKGVLKALASLQEGDFFNVIVFDHHLSELSERPISASAKSLKLAEEFLNKQPHGGRFAAADVPNYLEKLIPTSVSPKEVHTAILLTDGKSSLKAEKQQKAINRWMGKNQGKVSLYTAAIGEDNNLVFLDLISSCNGGELLYSDTHASFARKFTKLIMDLKNPIAKDIGIEVIPSNPDATISIFPIASYLPALHQNKPYLIQGSTDELTDFTLLMQGTNRDLKLQVEKKISFNKAQKGTVALQKKWEAKQASIHYDKFLADGSADSLNAAKKLLIRE